MNDLPQILKQLDRKKLPGFESHSKLAPTIDGIPFRKYKAPKTAYDSAVLLLLRIVQDKYQILFTLRSSNLNSHSGQISFPGGRVEIGETFYETALRETFEEIGLMPNLVEYIMELSPLYVPPSNSVIHPFVGLVTQNFEIVLNHQEVEEAFWIDLNYFLDKSTMVVEKWKFKDQLVDVPHWKIHTKQVLWGATAMILSEFIDILKDCINFASPIFTDKSKV